MFQELPNEFVSPTSLKDVVASGGDAWGGGGPFMHTSLYSERSIDGK